MSLVEAQQAAREFKHSYLGTEHILLGLLARSEGLAAQVLGALDVTSEAVRVEIATIVGEGDEETRGQIPFTPRSKKTLENALRESLSLGHKEIRTEHLLLGLLQDDDSVAMKILHDLEADPDKIQALIVSIPEQGRSQRRTWPALSDGLRADLETTLNAIDKARESAKASKDTRRFAMIVHAERLLSSLIETPDSAA